MKLKTEKVFVALRIHLNEIEEVKELLGILDCIEGEVPPFLNNLYRVCKEITGVPMSGLYRGTIVRSN